MHLLWQEVRKYKKILFLALFLATINQVFSLLDPQIFRLIIDNYATKVGEHTQAEFTKGVGLLLLLGISFAFISRTAKAFQNYFVNVITQRSGTNLYAKSVTHSFSLPYAVFEDERSGELLNKMQKARTDSQIFIGNTVNIFFLSAVSIIFVLIYSFWVYWLVGVAFLLLLPSMAAAIYFLSKKIKEAQQEIVRETASLSGSTTETIRNVELVKSLGLEDQEVGRLNAVNEKILNLELKKVRMVRKLDFIQGTLMNALNSSILFLMLWLVFTRVVTIGQFFTIWFYSFWIFQPLYQLGNLATSYQETKASLAELNKVLSQRSAPVPKSALQIDEVKKIEYKNVTFKYRQGGRSVLNDVCVDVQRGETVAFVGPSGSGKSTMVKLLSGLYMPTRGEILINDTDTTLLDTRQLRNKIGLVAQETQLFAGTVRENLQFVKPNASDEEILRALSLSQATTIIEKEGRGLDTKIGEGGVKLSGGERQRIAIARAILREPDVMVFDEATSSLDSITEKAITETIKKINADELDKKMINILVAHRLSTIAHADRIYVFEQGRIVEAGKHIELVKKGGLYAALWREQVAERSEITAQSYTSVPVKEPGSRPSQPISL